MITIEVTSKGVEAHGDIIPGQVIELKIGNACYRITRWGTDLKVCKVGANEKDDPLHQMP